MKPGLNRFHLQVDGLKRRCLLHVPAGCAATSLPVVLMLPGVGATARWTMLETRLPEQADQAGFLAVFPEGLPAHPALPTDFLHNPISWNDGSGMWGERDDLAFIGAVLDELLARYPVDPRRIYVTGFSNGAAFSFLVAARFSQRIAALGPVAGHCWLEQPHLARPVPTYYLIGTRDPLLPLDGGDVLMPWGQTVYKPPVRQTSQRWAAALGLPPKEQRIRAGPPASLYRYGPSSSGVYLDCCTIEGHGHHWPGGRGQFDAKFAGANLRVVNANEMLWEFFRQWVLP